MGIDPWRGQFHMEMTWWHLAHYGLWDRWPMAEKALDCYRRFLPVSCQLAAQLGYQGAKWPKSVGPEGRSAPWTGNQVLLWKQPHPLFFAELEYRLRPTRATLDKWAEILNETATHMADYPVRDAATGALLAQPGHASQRAGHHPRHRFRPRLLALGSRPGPTLAGTDGPASRTALGRGPPKACALAGG